MMASGSWASPLLALKVSKKRRADAHHACAFAFWKKSSLARVPWYLLRAIDHGAGRVPALDLDVRLVAQRGGRAGTDADVVVEQALAALLRCDRIGPRPSPIGVQVAARFAKLNLHAVANASERCGPCRRRQHRVPPPSRQSA